MSLLKVRKTGAIKELAGSPVVRDWLRNTHSSEEGRAVSLRLFSYWYDWLQGGDSPLSGLSPEDMVQRQKQLNRAYNLDEILLPQRKSIMYEVLRFLETNPEWRSSYKRKIHSSVRSFFIYYLGSGGFPKPNNGEEGKLKGKKRVQKNLTIEVLRDVVYRSDPMYRAVWSSMLSGGMGIGEIVKWSNGGIDELMDAMSKPIRVDKEEIIEVYLGARKHNVEMDFYTYISGSALENLKSWIAKREMIRNRATAPTPFPDSVFVGNTYSPLNRKAAQFYWISKLKQLGFWTGNGRRNSRSNMNIHQIRDVFKTRCHKASAFSDADLTLADYFMGHKSEKYDYDHVHNDREFRIGQYLLFQPWLDIKRIDIEKQNLELEAERERRMILEQTVKGLQRRLDEATADDTLQRRLEDQQRTIVEMQKSLEAINRRDAQRSEWEKLRKPPL